MGLKGGERCKIKRKATSLFQHSEITLSGDYLSAVEQAVAVFNDENRKDFQQTEITLHGDYLSAA